MEITLDTNKNKLTSIHEDKKKKSQLENVKCLKANVSMDDILGAIREGRERIENLKG